ncbi:hypothetical protein FPSE5266_07222 [Fusarium pseudograminearum]|nr:hypothetical protein FPSE5266_07222 [Fusarium pseudograminearum]
MVANTEDTKKNTDTDEVSQDIKDMCIQEVTALFPDICLQSLQSIAVPLHFCFLAVINHIIDLLDSGQTYKKREQPKQSIGKRKRDATEQDDGLENKLLKDNHLYNSSDREPLHLSKRDPPLVKNMIAGDFQFVPVRTVQKFLAENNYLLYPTYLALNKSIQQTHKPLSWKYKKTATVQSSRYKEENLENSIRSADTTSEEGQQEVNLMEELKAARLARRHANLERQKELEALGADKQNFDEAQSKGEIKECECCFADTPFNRLVHCNAENAHSFCIQCLRRNAEDQVGLSKYELACLSTEGCNAGFSYKERQKFLPESLASALDRIEQDENIRLAELPDLAQCPFCSYAEEYPPVAINKEFRCRKPECMATSCRLCKLVTHVPKTCNTPFIKDSGCNKMTCSKPNCRNVQCYVCHESCEYNHFDQPERGGKLGNCPLFEDSEMRHHEEVEEAEKNAKQKALQDNPDLEPEALDFNVSSNVKKDDDRRMKKSAAAAGDYARRYRPRHHHGNHGRRQENDGQARALPRFANEPIQHNLPRQRNEPVQPPQIPAHRQQMQAGQGQANQNLEQGRAMPHNARPQAQAQDLVLLDQQIMQLQALLEAEQQAEQQKRQQTQAQYRMVQQLNQAQQTLQQKRLDNTRNHRSLSSINAQQNLAKGLGLFPIPSQGAPAPQMQIAAALQPVPAGLHSQQGSNPYILPDLDFMPDELFPFDLFPPNGQ